MNRDKKEALEPLFLMVPAFFFVPCYGYDL